MTISFTDPFSPSKDASILDSTTFDLALSGGNLNANITDHITLGPNNRITSATGAKVTLSVTPSTGLFTGGTTRPGTSKPLSFSGALLQAQREGRGYFLGHTQSGQVRLNPGKP